MEGSGSANSINANSSVLSNERERRKLYTPRHKNAGGIKIAYNGLYAFMIGASDTNKGGHVVFNVASRLQIPSEKTKTRYAGLPNTQERLN